ncbi:hypothetical protein SK128_018259, partial [Halocaridina rubra]
KLKLSVDNMIEPKLHSPRRALMQLKEKTEAELSRMRSLSISCPVDESMEWVFSITHIHKPNGNFVSV